MWTIISLMNHYLTDVNHYLTDVNHYLTDEPLSHWCEPKCWNWMLKSKIRIFTFWIKRKTCLNRTYTSNFNFNI
jgi:hypothetical protein